jgi:hypothetical protein
MSAYKRGFSAEQLRRQYEDDFDALDLDELQIRYGRGRHNFMGDNPLTRTRITSYHLRSPLFVDQKGREYTPDAEPETDILWVRIPRTYALVAHNTLFGAGGVRPSSSTPSTSAARAAADASENPFPTPGEQLVLHYKHYGHKSAGPETTASFTVDVDVVLDTNAHSSAKIMLRNPIRSTRPQAYSDALKDRSERDVARRRAERTDRIYGK